MTHTTQEEEQLALAQESLRGFGIDAETFKEAFRHHPGGVAVITADAGDGPAALTVTSLASISADPPLLVFSVSDQSSAAATICGATSFVAHLTTADSIDIAKLAAAHGVDRFADATLWDRMPTGEPYYVAVKNRLRCRVIDEIRAGSSTVVVGLALEASELPANPGAPLAYHNRTWHRLDESSRLEPARPADRDGATA